MAKRITNVKRTGISGNGSISRCIEIRKAELSTRLTEITRYYGDLYMKEAEENRKHWLKVYEAIKSGRIKKIVWEVDRKIRSRMSV